MYARVAAVAAGMLVLALAPATAQAAPAFEPLKPCYVTAITPEGEQGEAVRLTAQGFTPNSKADFTLDGAVEETGLQVNEFGIVEVPVFPAPFVEQGTRPFSVTLTQQDNPVNTVTTTSLTSALDVDVSPETARPSQRIRFKGLGFTAEKPVFAHYVFRGKQRARVRMARRTGECGAWTARRRQFPMRAPRQGRWILQFDQSRRYVEGTSGRLRSAYVLLRIDISLVPR